MKKFLPLLVLLGTAHAAVPETINYQAYLSNTDGTPRDGAITATIAIYAEATSGVALWTDTLSVDADAGLFSVGLGSAGNPFPAGLFDVQRWIGITIAPDPEMTPRRALNSVAYSIRANDADSVQGMQAGDIIDSAVAAATGGYRFVGVTVSQVSPTGSVGFGGMNAACRTDFGPNARMATTEEVIENLGEFFLTPSWVRYTDLIVIGSAVVDVPSSFSSLSSNVEKMNCRKWVGFVPGDTGLVVGGPGPDYFTLGQCADALPVACSAP